MSAGRPWWTDADQAELDVILWEFVGAAWAHKRTEPGCARCREAISGWCPPLVDAWEAVEAWMARRRMLSRAEWLRERQNERNAA